MIQSSTAVTVRAASAGDADLMLDVMLRCWTGSVARDSSAYRETPAEIAAQITSGYGVFVSLDGVVVGCGRFVVAPGSSGGRDWVEIKRTGVLKSHRGQGLAAPMIAAMEAEALRRGHPGVQLGVRSDQPRLVAFWEALGYRIAHDVQLSAVNPLTPPPVTMRKWLQA